MSTHHGVHPIRKRQRRCSQDPSLHNQHIPPQLRRLAPKGRAYPVQHKLQPSHDNIQDQQPAEHLDPVYDVHLRNSAASQSGVPVSFDHDFTSSPLHPDHTVSSLEPIQDLAIAPCPNIYSNTMPFAWADDGAPELAPGNLFSGVVTTESHGLLPHLLYGNLQFRMTSQNRQGQDYCIPTHHTPEDAGWTAMAQPTIGLHQGQCSIRFSDGFTQGEIKYMLTIRLTT